MTATMNGRLLTARGKAADRCNVLNAAVPISTGPIPGGRAVAGVQVPPVADEAVRAGGRGSGDKSNTSGRKGNVFQRLSHETADKKWEKT